MSTLFTIADLRRDLIYSNKSAIDISNPRFLLSNDSVIRCNRRDSCCIFAEGLPRERVIIKNLSHNLITCQLSRQLTASIACLHCDNSQFVCTICNKFFDSKKSIVQHIKRVKKHAHIVESLSCKQANEHLNISFDSSDDEAVGPFDSDLLTKEHINNIHLESGLESGSDNEEDGVDNDSSVDWHNFKTKKALESHRLVEDLKKLVDERNSDSRNGLASEELDLLELRLIVGRALGVQEKSECLRVHPVDASRHLLFTNLMESLNESKREEVLLLLRLNTVVEKIYDQSSKWMQTRLSSDAKTLNKVNLKGPTSIKKALNISEVKHDSGGAYSDVVDSIHSMMLQQGPMGSLQDILREGSKDVVSTVIQCPKIQVMAREMWDEAILDEKKPDEIVPSFLFIWDDGFDNTESKSGAGGGLSMGTVTALDLKTGNMSRLRANTDVVTLSRSSVSHDETIGRLLSQLQKLRKPFKTFHRTMGFVYAMVRVVNVNRDRVQRNKVAGVLAHNGRCNQRWKYVLPPKGNEREAFYSCDSCFKRRVKACSDPGPVDIHLNNDCQECCDFNVDKNQHLQKVNIHDKCPTQLLPGSPRPPSIVPISTTNRSRISFKMNFKMMRMAVRTATYHHVIGFWSDEATTYYLREIGINSSTISKILNFKELNEHRNTEEVIQELENCQYRSVIPHVWQYDDVCDIDDNIDPLMHMIFEGLIKVMYKEVIPEAISILNVDTDCMSMIQDQLKAVRKMSVSWIRTESLAQHTLKPSGWRGVDFVAAARLLKNCISHIKTAITAEGGQYMETKLKIYNIFEQFIYSCHSMVARVMCDSCTEESINEVEQHIKLFLSASERYSKLVLDRDSDKTFMSLKGNFLSLLNIPDEMRKFGPLRRYWDGDYEAFVKLIKEVLPGGLKRNGAATLVAKLIRFKERTSLMLASNRSKEYLLSKNFITESVVYDRNKPMHIYQSLSLIEDLLSKKVPLSGVMVTAQNNEPAILIAYKVKSKKRVHHHSDQKHGEQELNCLTLNWNTYEGRWVAGEFYIPFNIQERVSYTETNISFSVLRRNQIRTVVLVPMITSNESNNSTQLRCVISDDWTEMDNKSAFKVGQIHTSSFHV